MRAAATRAALLLLALLPALPAGARAELFLSPGLEAEAGYTSNRFYDTAEESSAYSYLAPSLSLTWFGPDRLELYSSLQYRRTDYLEDDFGRIEETVGQATLSKGWRAWGAALDLSGGLYEDSELSSDDSRWVRAAPTVSRNLGASGLASLTVAATRTRFESRETLDGDPQEDTHLQVRPGLSWAPSASATIWIDGYYDLHASNSDWDEYSGFGTTAGFDVLAADVVRLGAWGLWSRRDYDEAVDQDGEDREDTPYGGGVWLAVRLLPWAELTSSASWMNYRSTDELNDYRVWTVDGGLRVVYDWPVGP